MVKYIFITGGVVSGIGKGITAASLGLLLSRMGYRVGAQKLDPYLNIDPGTMNPFEHGEVFVLADGMETDLDLGHYERYLGTELTRECSVTSGQVYRDILQRERTGDYLGKTVQIVPHVVDEMKRKVQLAAEKTGAEVMLVEIGGTVGDIEAQAFYEAARQLQREAGAGNAVHVHVAFLPWLATTKELKSKPLQNSVRELRRSGIEPDFVVARADHHIAPGLLAKIAQMTGLAPERVVPAETAEHSIYEVPLHFAAYGADKALCSALQLEYREPQLDAWRSLVHTLVHSDKTVRIGMVGKYNALEDSYFSVIESLVIAAGWHGCKLDLHWIDSEKLEQDDADAWAQLRSMQGILVPGGFGRRGSEGKIAAARHCRTSGLPYLGLCLGSQIMMIDMARQHLNPAANSTEFDENTPLPIVHIMEGQKDLTTKGGNMRLGSYACRITPGTAAHRAYGREDITERHRHRYEMNNEYRAALEQAGLVVSGRNPELDLAEIVEIAGHPFMVGSQYHPEFLSRPDVPHPLFMGFIAAAVQQSAQ